MLPKTNYTSETKCLAQSMALKIACSNDVPTLKTGLAALRFSKEWVSIPVFIKGNLQLCDFQERGGGEESGLSSLTPFRPDMLFVGGKN